MFISFSVLHTTCCFHVQDLVGEDDDDDEEMSDVDEDEDEGSSDNEF